MTDEERLIFRRKIGQAIINIQNAELAAGQPRDEVVAEIMAALLSLSTYVAYHNAQIPLVHFKQAVAVAIAEQWPKNEGFS